MDFRRQKWYLAYKYSVFNLQSGISPYKLASRVAIQRYKRDSRLAIYQIPFVCTHLSNINLQKFDMHVIITEQRLNKAEEAI